MNELSNSIKKDRFSMNDYLKFGITSILAFLIFLGPVESGGHTTTVLSWVISSIRGILGRPNRVPFTFWVINIGVLLTLVANYSKTNNSFLVNYMKTSTRWMVVRVFGAIFMFMVYFQVGPEFIWNANTGKTMASMSSGIAITFMIGGLILPFLTNFGALEFIGTFLTKIMRKAFKVPGMSAIDCLVSWIGSSGLGMYLTSQMHKNGKYTDKEAAIIATSFSLVSLPYLYVMVEMVELGHRVYQFIFAAYTISFIIGLVTCRIWPLNKYPDTNINGEKINQDVSLEGEGSIFSRAVTAGVVKAKDASYKESITAGIMGGFGLCFGIVPIVLALGTVALAVFEYTTILQTISLPFGWLCSLVGFPEAKALGSAITIGYVDQTLAAVVGSTLVPEAARFFSIIIATSGVLYIAQPIPILLGSTIPLSFKDITIIYIERIVLSIFLSIPFLMFFF